MAITAAQVKELRERTAAGSVGSGSVFRFRPGRQRCRCRLGPALHNSSRDFQESLARVRRSAPCYS